jgi:hypothetical protein
MEVDTDAVAICREDQCGKVRYGEGGGGLRVPESTQRFAREFRCVTKMPRLGQVTIFVVVKYKLVL